MTKPTVEERFWAKVKMGAPDECWEWTAATMLGYGIFSVNRRKVLAHRWWYEQVNGPIDGELVCDHICHTLDLLCPGGECIHRRCVNPGHIEPVTRKANMERGRTAAAIIAVTGCCRKGHPMTPDNITVLKDGRRCRTCFNAYYRTPEQQARRRVWEAGYRERRRNLGA